ncbi:MAG: sigma-70 family RNA polymerase sigma factor [Candidatus Margulisbacteria bacterium]|nr:sigma-70 family RNA polymerase sigma factor [Candidatus Margulisiibacteriota bacterium]
MKQYEFNEVYEACKDMVWKLVSRYVFSREDREDLFQEVFLNVHRALPRFRGEAKVGTWVFSIAVNVSINYIKKQKRYRWLTDMLGAFRIIEPEAVEAATDVGELKPLAKLSARQRMILLLAEVEEMKLGKVAQLMKMPVGTVKSNLHRAREIIKKEVRENGGI